MRKIILIVFVGFLFFSCTYSDKQTTLTDSRLNGEFDYKEDVQNWMTLKFDGTNKAWIMIVSKGETNSEYMHVRINPTNDKITMRIWDKPSTKAVYDSVSYRFSNNGQNLDFDGMKFTKTK